MLIVSVLKLFEIGVFSVSLLVVLNLCWWMCDWLVRLLYFLFGLLFSSVLVM